MIGRALVVGLSLLVTLFVNLGTTPVASQTAEGTIQHFVEPGDTWLALSWRYGVDEEVLRAKYPHPNPQIQPAIGQIIDITGPVAEDLRGAIVNSADGGLLQLSAVAGANPWALVLVNQLASPYQPLLYRPIRIPGGPAAPKQLPAGVSSLEVSRAPALPGEALAIRGMSMPGQTVSASFASRDMNVSAAGQHFVALTGTGAFFEPGQYPLEIAVAGEPLWSQPWRVAPGEWTYEEITYTGEAATISSETIQQERQRLNAIWDQVTAQPYWTGSFTEPLQSYLGYSSLYGARRSYGGGPYNYYHEGLDFSAYGGTPVYAPAAGQVVLAEQLAARGGAVIIDHGLGVFSGFYHLSEIDIAAGQVVAAGDLLGRVGSTGLSTGNHLHWDLLVGGTWVSPAAWREGGLACWLLAGLGMACQ